MSASERAPINQDDFGEGVDKSINLPKGYLSPSAISTYLKCPKKYEFYYIHNLPTPSSPELVKGLAVHAGIELYYLSKIEDKELDIDSVQDHTITTLQKQLKDKEVKVSEAEYNSMEKAVQGASKNYVEVVGKHTTPKTVEAELKCVIRGVPIVGYTDLIREMNSSEKEVQSYLLSQGVITPEESVNSLVIADNKTSKKKWSHKDLENSLQLVIYSIGTGITHQEIHNIVFNNENSIHLINNICSASQMNHVSNIIEDVSKGISAGFFPRCDMGSWWCSETFCPFYKICRP